MSKSSTQKHHHSSHHKNQINDHIDKKDVNDINSKQNDTLKYGRVPPYIRGVNGDQQFGAYVLLAKKQEIEPKRAMIELNDNQLDTQLQQCTLRQLSHCIAYGVDLGLAHNL
ncbi:MAG: hypothetical protein EZS28_025302 [Streblomastix strix]|uniref:Uncharacterized protein n=1 Tax=Streblomastix strix TaxID=222440 RepID=A0A5J4V9K7_9EUKA|nr:MAG: hypothetical protein EZS28_025302 [Streblomastix strix]